MRRRQKITKLLRNKTIQKHFVAEHFAVDHDCKPRMAQRQKNDALVYPQKALGHADPEG